MTRLTDGITARISRLAVAMCPGNHWIAIDRPARRGG